MRIFKNLKLIIKDCDDGFTLIELAIYLGILSILLLVLTTFLTNALDAQLESQQVSTVEQDSKYILNRLYYDLTNADSITTPANPGNQTANLVLVRNGVTYTYALNGTNLTLTDNVGTDVLNNPNDTVSGLNFYRIGYTGQKPTVQISFVVTSNIITKGLKDTESFKTTVSLR